MVAVDDKLWVQASLLFATFLSADFRPEKFPHLPTLTNTNLVPRPDSADISAAHRRQNCHLEDKCRRPRLVDRLNVSGIAIETSNFLHLRMTR
jgi:hypothetical protein